METIDLSTVSKIVIEKQPSRNPKMKQIEHMIHAYFIIKGILNIESSIKAIEIFNPMHKLGAFHLKGSHNYKDRKRISVDICKSFLNHIVQSDNILNIFNSSKKKDDLADCLLQALISNKFNYDVLTIDIHDHNINPRKPTQSQSKKGYSKSNLKYIFHSSNIDFNELDTFQFMKNQFTGYNNNPNINMNGDCKLIQKSLVKLYKHSNTCIEDACTELI